MKHKLFVLLSVLALLFALQVTPVYAGDDKAGANPPCTACDGNLSQI